MTTNILPKNKIVFEKNSMVIIMIWWTVIYSVCSFLRQWNCDRCGMPTWDAYSSSTQFHSLLSINIFHDLDFSLILSLYDIRLSDWEFIRLWTITNIYQQEYRHIWKIHQISLNLESHLHLLCDPVFVDRMALQQDPDKWCL